MIIAHNPEPGGPGDGLQRHNLSLLEALLSYLAKRSQSRSRSWSGRRGRTATPSSQLLCCALCSNAPGIIRIVIRAAELPVQVPKGTYSSMSSNGDLEMQLGQWLVT